MSRIKIILSIFLLAALIATGIILPTHWRTEKQKARDTPTLSKEEPNATDDVKEELQPELSYLNFDKLSVFFPGMQIDEIRTLFSTYFKERDLNITTVTFEPERTEYPDGGSTLLYFSLSDGTDLPVTISTSSGAFFFGEEQKEMNTEAITYERETDDTLPDYSSDEIFEMQEGGYADTFDDIDELEEVSP